MAAMSREVRRIVVAHLASLHMPVPKIADELGVSRETVRRDLLDAPPPAPTAATPDAAPDVAGGKALVLRLDAPMRASLAVLREVCNGPDTEAQNVAAARAAIHATADTIRERTFART
ncbi:helix-turn-helix domain-containing protein [Streptomyces sp. S3(2020)]|uniref:helix-turn-helix domain-containing protein n=1 Tax=Streptomyces sp. S3(2020) TaxID=2732044 RepID=UPI001F0FF686|nr:helix-turn-helix domain-containing protein [Streptomyces sp. S3(2020)]